MTWVTRWQDGHLVIARTQSHFSANLQATILWEMHIGGIWTMHFYRSSLCRRVRVEVDREVFTEDLRRDLDTQGSKAAWAHGYALSGQISTLTIVGFVSHGRWKQCANRSVYACTLWSVRCCIETWDVCVHRDGDGSMIGGGVNGIPAQARPIQLNLFQAWHV